MKRNSYNEVLESPTLKRRLLKYLFSQYRIFKNYLIGISTLYKCLSNSESRYRLLRLIDFFQKNRVFQKVNSNTQIVHKSYEGFYLQLNPSYAQMFDSINCKEDLDFIVDMHVGKKRKFRGWLLYQPIFDNCSKLREMTIGYLGQDVLIYLLENENGVNIRKITYDLNSSGRAVKKNLILFEELQIINKVDNLYFLNTESPFVKFLGFFWLLDCLSPFFMMIKKVEYGFFTRTFLGNDMLTSKQFSKIFSVLSVVILILSDKLNKCK